MEQHREGYPPYSQEYVDRLVDERDAAYEEGLREGIRRYAWWKDGVEYVGSCGTRLDEALRRGHETA